MKKFIQKVISNLRNNLAFKFLIFLKLTIGLMIVLGLSYSFNQTNKIIDSHQKMNQNYNELKRLTNDLIEINEVNKEQHNTLLESKRKIEFDENMISKIKPNVTFLKYFHLILSILCGILVYLVTLEKRIINMNSNKGQLDKEIKIG
jgi:predicted PurR-regulated permease PerM